MRYWTSSRARLASIDLRVIADMTPAPPDGQKVVIDDVLASAGIAIKLDFSEETTGTVLFSIRVQPNSTAPFSSRSQCKLDTANKKVRVIANVIGAVEITMWWHPES